MAPTENSHFLDAAVAAAKAGAAQLLAFRGQFSVREKAPSDLVTDADIASQNAIQEVIQARFPAHGFLAEEGVDLAGKDEKYRWVVDPLDGTVNYAHGVPGYCVSIALLTSGEPSIAVVYDPVSRELFTAIAGQGARLNGQPISASGVSELSQAMMVASFSAGVTRDSLEIGNFVDVLIEAQSLRRTGSAAQNLAFVATGRFDGYWATSVKIWDIAAGWLLVTEAGGVICPLEGTQLELERPRFVAAATPKLSQRLLEILKLP